jgi:hypothetical protein
MWLGGKDETERTKQTGRQGREGGRRRNGPIIPFIRTGAFQIHRPLHAPMSAQNRETALRRGRLLPRVGRGFTRQNGCDGCKRHIATAPRQHTRGECVRVQQLDAPRMRSCALSVRKSVSSFQRSAFGVQVVQQRHAQQQITINTSTNPH